MPGAHLPGRRVAPHTQVNHVSRTSEWGRRPRRAGGIHREHPSREEAAQTELRERERRAAEEAPWNNLEAAGQRFCGWPAALVDEFYDRFRKTPPESMPEPTRQEYLDRFARLTSTLRLAITAGGFGDFWNCFVAAMDDARIQVPPIGDEVRQWLLPERDDVHHEYGTDKGRGSWGAVRYYLSLDVAQFTRDYCFVKRLPSPITLGGVRRGLYTLGVFCRALMEYLHPEVGQFRELLERVAPERRDRDGFVANTISHLLDVLAQHGKVDKEAVEGWSVCQAIVFLTPPVVGDDQGVEPPAPPQPLPAPTCGDGFEWMRCELGEFTFTKNQRHAVEALWIDWQKDGLGCSSDRLCRAAGAENDLRDLFKDNTAWGTLIVRRGDRKDLYSLAPKRRSAYTPPPG